LNKERHSELDGLRTELAAARAAASDFETKYKSQASRTHNLEGMVAGLKSKLQVLLEKSKGDDRLVGALRTELARARGETPGAASRTSGSGFYSQFDAAALPGGDADAAAGINGPGAAAGGADALLLRQRLQEAEDQIDKQQKARARPGRRRRRRRCCRCCGGPDCALVGGPPRGSFSPPRVPSPSL
jgi:hypothetical protein